jgi:hypothetical protein
LFNNKLSEAGFFLDGIFAGKDTSLEQGGKDLPGRRLTKNLIRLGVNPRDASRWSSACAKGYGWRCRSRLGGWATAKPSRILIKYTINE